MLSFCSSRCYLFGCLEFGGMTRQPAKNPSKVGGLQIREQTIGQTKLLIVLFCNNV
jgi:hypothetical protein